MKYFLFSVLTLAIPLAMASQASATSTWGVLPPTCVTVMQKVTGPGGIITYRPVIVCPGSIKLLPSY